MEVKIGGFVLAVHLGELFVSVPKLGEVYWSSKHGLTASRG